MKHQAKSEPVPQELEVADGSKIIAVPNGDGLITKAFSIERIRSELPLSERPPCGWVHVTYYVQGGKIIHTERTEPDLRAIVTETWAIKSVRYWTSIG